MYTYKSIIILGSNGMLGQMVKKYFTMAKYTVHIIDSRFEEENCIAYVNEINKLEDSIVINCIGKIKQKSGDLFELIWSNTILPLELSRNLRPGHFLIHPSTDCVFKGDSEVCYPLYAKHDADDFYGWTKSIGETAAISSNRTLIIRVSIIGPDYKSNKGLLSWFLNLPTHSKLNGFVDHFWNGITTLEWCKQLEKLIKNNVLISQSGNIIQLGTSERYTKFDMLNLFQEVFGTDHNIIKYNSKQNVNRCLEPQYLSNSLDTQLKELYAFMKL